MHRAIATFIKQKEKQKGFRSTLQPGAVTLIQRFGGSLNLNVHYHMLFLEGGYYETKLDQGPKFWWPKSETTRRLTMKSKPWSRYSQNA